VSYAIRRAAPDDAALLAEHRARVWREVGDWDAEELAPQIPVWTEWMRGALADGTYAAWIAEDDEREPIGSGAVLVHLAIPRPGSPSDCAGRVQSVYVVPSARRSGVARAIMEEAITFARVTNLVFLALHPSDEARPLYESLGFTHADEMLLRFGK
jgi:GNAT superfamily N-acetyltransferase